MCTRCEAEQARKFAAHKFPSYIYARAAVADGVAAAEERLAAAEQHEQQQQRRMSNSTTLVCFTGQLRGSSTVWESAMTHLIRPNHADVAVVSEDPLPSWLKAPRLHHRRFTMPRGYRALWERLNGKAVASAVHRAYSAGVPIMGAYGDGEHTPGITGTGSLIWYNMQQLRLYLREAGLLDAYPRFIITRTDFLYLCRPQLVVNLAPTAIKDVTRVAEFLSYSSTRPTRRDSTQLESKYLTLPATRLDSSRESR